MQRGRALGIGWLLVSIVALGAAIAAHGDDQATATSTTTERPVTVTTPPPVVVNVTTSTTAAPATTDAPEGRNPLGGDDAEDKRMPDVVCLDLQEAQDEIQDHGVFFSKSEDATGEGRRQLWDRNWIVVRQDPAAGEPIGEGEAVLYVVKTDEPNDC